MGNAIQKGSLDMAKYQKELTIQETPTLSIDLLQNTKEVNDKVLAKDITSVVRQMSPANQLEILRKIHSQPYWFTLLKFDEWTNNNEKVNMIHTKISAHSLDNEISALRKGSLQPQIKNCWFVVTNLLLAVMDMEHRLDFHQNLSTKNVYLNSDRTMTILNPYMRDSHLQKILEDVVIPAKNCPDWKTEYEESYYARVADLQSNQRLSDVHFVHQNYVKDMVKSVGLITLAFVCRRKDNEYYVDSSIKGVQGSINNELISKDLNMIDERCVDPDLTDFLEYIIKYEPSSAIELGSILTTPQYTKMMSSLKDSHLVCPDPELADILLMEMKGKSPYDPDFIQSIPCEKKTIVGPAQRQTSSNFNVFDLLGNPGQPSYPNQNKPIPVRDTNDRTSLNFATVKNDMQPATELNALRSWIIGHEVRKEILPSEVDRLNQFTIGKDKLNGQFATKEKDIDFIKKFMVRPEGNPIENTNFIIRASPNTDSRLKSSRLQPTAAPSRSCGCHYDSPCHCYPHVHLTHMHHHRTPGHLHLHYDNPVYSPYSHLYYMGRPLTGSQADNLHANPVHLR